jgi:hypothetical protein
MYGWYHEDYSTVDKINDGTLKESKFWVAKYAEKH